MPATTSKKIGKGAVTQHTNITLDTKIEQQFRLNPFQKKALKALKLETVGDLLYHFPARYGDTAQATYISSLVKGEQATIYGKIENLKTGKGFRTKIPMATGIVADESGKIELVWFNQPYIAKMIQDGAVVRVEGRVSARRKDDALYFSNPKIETVTRVPIGVGDSLFGSGEKSGENSDNQSEGLNHHIYPVYPESRGITSNWIYHAIDKIFRSGLIGSNSSATDNNSQLEDPIPRDVLEKYNLPTLKTALVWIHMPRNISDATAARKRFAFEEVFFIQLMKQKSRLEYSNHRSFIIDPTRNQTFTNQGQRVPHDAKDMLINFIKRFPFPLSTAQIRAIDDVLGDMRSGRAMSRLLEGDVGSGKTAVAAATAFAAITTKPNLSSMSSVLSHSPSQSIPEFLSRPLAKSLSKSAQSTPQGQGMLQVAYMCPTEILAIQHFESFIQYFAYLGVSVALITGSGCRKFPSKTNPKSWTDISRSQLLKWVENGEIPIVIGTHALIQKSVKFRNLGYVIIDEQHRFGTAQRAKLVRKDDIAPHLLSMTATPIPRTLALTIYGDLDISLLDVMPAGRKIPITKIAKAENVTEASANNPHGREQIYEAIRTELNAGRQAYVICPRIDAPDPNKEAALNARSVKEEASRLKKEVFPEYSIGILHSKMKPQEKDKVMQDFKANKIQILCSTSVVEVGVNVPNANVIIIEGAERFGLAQLHQLRGRVIRGTHQPYCYLFAESLSDTTIERLRAFTSAKNGFELAEYDLRLRGAGSLYSGKQWGISDLAMEALKNIKMVEAARNEARLLLEQDPTLIRWPKILTAVNKLKKDELHFE